MTLKGETNRPDHRAEQIIAGLKQRLIPIELNRNPIGNLQPIRVPITGNKMLGTVAILQPEVRILKRDRVKARRRTKKATILPEVVVIQRQNQAIARVAEVQDRPGHPVEDKKNVNECLS
jgi:hypothetical protein